MKTIWLLDVDGVINANKPGWSAAPHRANAYCNGISWPLRWAPALLDNIRAVRASGLVEIVWCTTWCSDTDQLERLWRLPALDRAWTHEVTGEEAEPLKRAAAQQVIADGHRLIWTDDVVTPSEGDLYDELTADGRALLITPSWRRGLQPDHLQDIALFAEEGQL